MAFIFKEGKSPKLNVEEEKELITALASGATAEIACDIFKVDKKFLEKFIAEHEEDIIKREQFNANTKVGDTDD